METILVLYILNGLTITVLRMRQIELIRRWKEGTLSYEILLACKKKRLLDVRKLNPEVKLAKEPTLFKKDE